MATQGTCTFCGNEAALNNKGLCGKCKHMLPCAVHPDLLTAQRCKVCRKAACAFCILQGICASCRESGAEAVKGRGGKRGRPNLAALAGQQKLFALGGVLVALVGFNYYWFFTQTKPALEVYHDRLVVVHDLIMDLNEKQGHLPTTLAELRTQAQSTKVELPLMVPAAAKPIPGAVVYAFDGKKYDLTIMDDTGKPFMVSGQPMTMSAP